MINPDGAIWCDCGARLRKGQGKICYVCGCCFCSKCMRRLRGKDICGCCKPYAKIRLESKKGKSQDEKGRWVEGRVEG